jgi:hypothetical protein
MIGESFAVNASTDYLNKRVRILSKPFNYIFQMSSKIIVISISLKSLHTQKVVHPNIYWSRHHITIPFYKMTKNKTATQMVSINQSILLVLKIALVLTSE